MQKDFVLKPTIWIFTTVIMVISGGCGNFFEKKPTEIETRLILQELEQIKENSRIKNPLPELYLKQPEIIATPKGLKLFYFSKQHPVAELAKLVKEQMGNSISVSPATNQLIIQCADQAEAEKILEFLKAVDVPPIQVNIDCIVLERFADVTMDWETTIFIENLFNENITLGDPDNPAFPGASLRESKRANFGLDIGYLDVDGDVFKATLDMLVSRGYLKILMNPNLETVNGQPAEIKSRENAPIQRIVTGKDFEPYSLTDYQWVTDSLKVTPHVYADGSIGLKTEVMIGSRSKPEGVVQLSIITERSATIAENRIAPGQSLVIGGIRKSEQRSVIRGVPFLKDLPFLGILFSSKDYEEKGTEIIFILTPSISNNGIDNEIVTKDIKEKFKSPAYKPGIQELITEPFSGNIYTEHVERKAAEAEYHRLTAEIERSEAREEIELLREELTYESERLKQQQQEALKARKEADEALKKLQEKTIKFEQEQKKAVESQKAAQAAQAEAEKLKQLADEKAKEIEKVLQEKNLAKTEAEKIKQQAQKTAEDALKKAQAAQAEAEKLKKMAVEKAQQVKEAEQARTKALQEAQEAKKVQDQHQKALEERVKQLQAEKASDSQSQPEPNQVETQPAPEEKPAQEPAPEVNNDPNAA